MPSEMPDDEQGASVPPLVCCVSKISHDISCLQSEAISFARQFHVNDCSLIWHVLSPSVPRCRTFFSRRENAPAGNLTKRQWIGLALAVQAGHDVRITNYPQAQYGLPLEWALICKSAVVLDASEPHIAHAWSTRLLVGLGRSMVLVG